MPAGEPGLAELGVTPTKVRLPRTGARDLSYNSAWLLLDDRELTFALCRRRSTRDFPLSTSDTTALAATTWEPWLAVPNCRALLEHSPHVQSGHVELPLFFSIPPCF